MKDIDRYLHLIGYNLQLSDAKFEELNKNYKALCTYIANNHKLADDAEWSIYQQGSFAIDTAIRPLRSEDFDVDMVVEFNYSKNDYTPKEFYNMLYETFKNGRYGSMIETHRNCITVNYSNNYHFDIMPSIPASSRSTNIFAPDLKKNDWVARLPKKYKEWFLDKAKLISQNHYKIINFNNRYLVERMEGDVAPLEKPKDYELKPTLNRVVQLIKRARDVFFKDVDDYIPQSIVLTTLAGDNYCGEYSISECLFNIAMKMKRIKNKNSDFKVMNPVSGGSMAEEYTEKWHKERKYYQNFSNFVDHLCFNVYNIYNNIDVRKSLIELFGQSDFDKLYEATRYDGFWNNDKSNVENVNVFPDKPVEIKKKERGNAR